MECCKRLRCRISRLFPDRRGERQRGAVDVIVGQRELQRVPLAAHLGQRRDEDRRLEHVVDADADGLGARLVAIAGPDTTPGYVPDWKKLGVQLRMPWTRSNEAPGGRLEAE